MEGRSEVSLTWIFRCWLFMVTHSCKSCACFWHRLLEGMAVAGVKPNVWSYNTAIGACGKAGEWKEALRLALHGMWDDRLFVATYSGDSIVFLVLAQVAKGNGRCWGQARCVVSQYRYRCMC